MSADATLWSSEAWASAPDVTLLARTREGSAEAFGELWRRHLPAAYAVANRHRGRSAPEDVVAEAAARVLALIRDGRGPDENFRAYFLSAVRTVAVDQGRRDLRLVPTEDDDLEELAPALADPFAGLAADEEGLALVRTAFAELSERDQRILWHTTVEGAAPRAVAPVLGMTANAVSVRAMRAREALRANYLDARAARELPGADSDDCRWTVTHLGALVRGRLPKRQTERARAHVEGCPHAAALAAELRAIHDGFPAIVVPAVLAAGLMTPGFVSGGAATALSATTTAVSGSTAAASAGQARATVPAGASPGAAAGTSSATGSASATGSSSATGRLVDAVAQLAGRATNVAAALAVTAGVTGALSVPGPSLADAKLPSPGPSTHATAPAAPRVAPSVAPGPAVPPSRQTSTAGGPSATSSPSGTGDLRGALGEPRRTAAASQGVDRGASAASAASASAGASSAEPSSGSPRPAAPASPVAQPPGASSASGTSAPPRPPATAPTPPEPPAAAPTAQDPPPSEPAPSDGVPVVSARLVTDGDSPRISVRVRTAVTAGLTVSIGNLAGAGRLTVRNSSWDCVQVSRATVACTGGRGSAVLDQSGAGGVVPLVVRITDAAGRTWTETVRPR